MLKVGDDLGSVGSGSAEGHSHRENPIASGVSADQIRVQLVDVLNDTISKMSADAKLSIRAVILSILLSAMESKLQELAITPSKSISDKAAFQVPKSLALVVDVGFMVETVIRDMATDRLTALIENNLLDAASRFNIVALQLLDEG